MHGEDRIRELVRLGDNLRRQGLPAKARERYLEALALLRETGGDGSLSGALEQRLAELDAGDSPG